MLDLSTLNFEKGAGLVTVVTQDARTGAVLMVAHADREAVERTLATGEMHYRSRSRGLWHKGATSGNVQRVVSLTADCDGDAVLARVEPAGPACHTGAVSCFGDDALGADVFGLLDATIAARAADGAAVPRHQGGSPPFAQGSTAPTAVPYQSDASPVVGNAPKPSYTQRLLADRNLRLKKLGEEATELAVACADEDAPRAAEEAADLVYHTLVAVRALGLTLADVRRVLAGRHR
jgi:phosphoribosyl-ATP pyrophosphohydrolase/phosphoribosyl-AMP cyclohydrolase